MLRGQGYDGASNMRGEFNGLQRKILDENPYAFYVHCFAHRLQLVVVAVATSSCSYIHDFFEYVSLIVTTTSSSCKKMEVLVEETHKDLSDRLERGKYLQEEACINKLALLDLEILDGVDIIQLCFAWTKCGPL